MIRLVWFASATHDQVFDLLEDYRERLRDAVFRMTAKQADKVIRNLWSVALRLQLNDSSLKELLTNTHQKLTASATN